MLEHNSYPRDVGDVPEPVASPLNEPVKGRCNDECTRAIPKDMKPGVNPKAPRAEASFSQDLEVTGFTVGPRDTEDVARSEICGLLIEHLEDMNFLLFCIAIL
jgi:hypothetical protein